MKGLILRRDELWRKNLAVNISRSLTHFWERYWFSLSALLRWGNRWLPIIILWCIKPKTNLGNHQLQKKKNLKLTTITEVWHWKRTDSSDRFMPIPKSKVLKTNCLTCKTNWLAFYKKKIINLYPNGKSYTGIHSNCIKNFNIKMLY